MPKPIRAKSTWRPAVSEPRSISPAHGAGSVQPIAGGDQHRPRRRDHAGDRDQTDGRDWLGERDDGNVIWSETNGPREARVPDETGNASTGTGDGRERYGRD